MKERKTIWEPLDILLVESTRCGIENLPSYWKSQPEDKDKLEGVVEWEPVDRTDGALKDRQESKDDPVLESRS